MKVEEVIIRRWWCKKYSLPPTSDEFLRYTLDELVLEFYEDYYDSNAEGKLERELEEDDGEEVCFVTGDEEFDELEKRITEGTISDEELETVLNSWTGETPKAKDAEKVEALVSEIGDGFEDAY